ncbi:adenylosuccinate synthetase [Caldivirga maquilingensis]|uniref:Adenylosuccinate synthetase n=1 Tax=Caldivirga maquilingensis (strain ATCC 700844 / DSM 13496 / JCM 10307 / IC-167) TaxID=397948 RepID=A8M9J2_CALMQ|nr:adenylosuccinate synthetase [Caldivirga maquilingensis]ABW00873.1 Adenylosuccinate synthase [Caldivirga maquilingensis IC-167]
MPLTVVVGGFFGDEGKGKVISYLSLVDKPDICVRTGSINAGHTVNLRDRTWKVRIIPSCFPNEETRLMIAPGALFSISVLMREIDETGSRGRVWVDYSSGIIEDKHVEAERRDEYLMKTIGSTGQGVGAAMVDRVLRRLKLARDFEELRGMLIDVPREVNESLERGRLVIIEGTQGTFLSLYHGTYPYVTSRDTTASGIISEVGVSPRSVSDIILIFKAFVSRVGAGELPGELKPEEAEARGWVEKGTVTGRLRRVAPFNIDLAKRAVMLNKPTQIAITKLDALFPEARGRRKWGELPTEARKWINNISEELGVPVTLIGTGEDALDMVDLRGESQ